MNSEQIMLVYDKDCPVCNKYCQMVRVRDSFDQFQIVNAREGGKILDEITARGLDMDQGMVLIVGDQYYFGADAMHALALMSHRVGFFNKLNYWMFKSKGLSKVIYPILRFCRNLLLKFLGRKKIKNLKKQ